MQGTPADHVETLNLNGLDRLAASMVHESYCGWDE